MARVGVVQVETVTAAYAAHLLMATDRRVRPRDVRYLGLPYQQQHQMDDGTWVYRALGAERVGTYGTDGDESVIISAGSGAPWAAILAAVAADPVHQAAVVITLTVGSNVPTVTALSGTPASGTRVLVANQVAGTLTAYDV